MEEHQKTEDSKYIQQHLANERTYLAWIRTCIAIIGVGFLITNLHFSSGLESGIVLSKSIGLASIIIGAGTVVFSTIAYFQKAKSINRSTFLYGKAIIIFLSATILCIVIAFFIYFWVVWA